jgi:trehalose synthase
LKSIREGFGLVVAETLWKGTPVVAGRAGGIPLQLEDGRGGALVDREEDWVPRIEELLADSERRDEEGERGREWVRDHFLITRAVEDELKVMAEVVGEGVE